MEIFQNLGKTIEQVARQVGDKSEEVWTAGKLNIEIFKQEDSIRKIQRKIGEQASAQYNEGKKFDDQINTLCAEIQEKEKKIDKLRISLRQLRDSEKQSKKQAYKQSEEQKEQNILRTSECSPNGPEISYNEAVEKMKKAKRSE